MLTYKGKLWTKKDQNSTFEVPIGSYFGAENEIKTNPVDKKKRKKKQEKSCSLILHTANK